MPLAHGHTPRALTALSRSFTAAAPPARRAFRHFLNADLGRPASQSSYGATSPRSRPQTVCRRDSRVTAPRRFQRQTLTPLAVHAFLTELSNSSYAASRR